MPQRVSRPPYTLIEMLRLIPRSSFPIGVAWNKCEEAADRIEELEAALRYATEYVGRLAVKLAEKHYPDQRFELLPNLLGRIDQIDNMTCGLARAALEGGKKNE